jgi:hypothetical protein
MLSFNPAVYTSSSSGICAVAVMTPGTLNISTSLAWPSLIEVICLSRSQSTDTTRINSPLQEGPPQAVPEIPPLPIA